MEKVPFIFKKDERISQFMRGEAKTQMLAKADSIEVLRHTFPAKVTFHLTSANEWQGFEFLQINSGKLRYLDSETPIVLEAGDYIIRHLAPEIAMFEAVTDTEVLYMSSEPAFQFVRDEVEEFVEFAQQIEKDEYTEGHCYRIQHYSRLLGEHLGLMGESLNDLVNAAFFHDVGKSKVPKGILSKTSALNEEEWEVMKQHTVWGREMLEKKSHLKRVSQIVEQTHERVDGQGYPKGLMGDDILLEAKIISVVDTYDAMTTNRPYRKALPQQEALQRLHDGVDKQFDAQVVQAFIEMLKQHGLKLPEFDKEIIRLRRHESFLKLGEAILANTDIQQILEQVVNAITTFTPFQRAALALYDRSIPPHSKDAVNISRVACVGLSPEEETNLRDYPLPGDQRPTLFSDQFRISNSFYVPYEQRPWTEHPGWVSSERKSAGGNWHPEDFLCIPLWVGDDILGVISVDDPTDEQAPTAESLEPIEIFSNFAALAIERTRHLKQLNRFQDRLQAIYELSERLAQVDTVDALVKQTMQILTESFAYDHASISFLEDDVLVLQSFETRLSKSDYDIKNFERVPLGEGIIGAAAQKRCPVLVNDINKDERYISGHAAIQSECVVPIEDQQEVLGVVNLESEKINGFTNEDLALLQALARQLSAAISNLRRREQLQETLQEREWTNTFLKSLNQVDDLNDLLKLIIHRGIELLSPKADAGCLLLWNEQLKVFEFNTAVNRNTEALKAYTFTKQEIEQEILNSFNPILLTRSQQLDHHTLQRIKTEEEGPPGSTIAIPIRVAGELIAVFNINNLEKEDAFGQNDLEKAWRLVPEIELALSRIQHRDRLQAMAIHDPLTGVYNRHYLSELIDKQADDTLQQAMPVSLVMVDFISFYQVNDRFGHLEGDRILSESAALFNQHIGAEDSVIRYGGDEFLIIMPNTPRKDAQQVCKHLQHQFQQKDWGLSIDIAFRVGVATWESDSAKSFDDVLEEADSVLYDHKRKTKIR